MNSYPAFLKTPEFPIFFIVLVLLTFVINFIYRALIGSKHPEEGKKKDQRRRVRSG